MSVFVYREPVPERVLPTADESVVVANGAVPMNALQVIGAGIRHDDAGATAHVPDVGDSGRWVRHQGWPWHRRRCWRSTRRVVLHGWAYRRTRPTGRGSAAGRRSRYHSWNADETEATAIQFTKSMDAITTNLSDSASALCSEIMPSHCSVSRTTNASSGCSVC